MVDAEVLEALSRIRAEAQRIEQAGDWRYVSVRSLACELGFSELVPLILAECVERGFSYCLDHTVSSLDGVTKERIFPSEEVCYWGPDQLRSRLDWVVGLERSSREN